MFELVFESWSTMKKSQQGNYTNYRIVEWLRLEQNSGGCLVQPSTRSRLLRAVFSWVLTISRDGDSTTYMGNLLQYWITLKIQGIE